MSSHDGSDLPKRLDSNLTWCVSKLPYLFQRFTSLLFDFHFVLAQLTVKPVRHFEPSKHAAFVGVLCGSFAATHPNKFFHVPISMANATNVFFLKGRIEKKLKYRRKYISAAKNLKIQGPTWGDVTRGDSQRRLLAQHSVATLLQRCFKWLQHFSNTATQCCAKNLRCESSCVTSPTLRRCYTIRFTTTIFSETQSCNIVATLFRMVTTLFQHCDVVLRWKSSLRIVPCNITFRKVLSV